jgi:hypothetical protein
VSRIKSESALVENKHLIIIGAQRSGSTMLYGILDQHPEISMAKPLRPEPKYFLSGDCKYEDYFTQVFKNSKNTAWLGEKSASYYELSNVAQRIKQTIPNAKLIVIMRNPVERAISNYRFSVKNGLENRSLKEVFIDQQQPPLLSSDISVDPFNYLGRGEYYTLLTPYYEVFDRDQILPLIFEDLVEQNSYDIIWRYLGVRSHGIIHDARYKNESSSVNDDIPLEILEVLYNHYDSHNAQLQAHLDLDLTNWNFDYAINK